MRLLPSLESLGELVRAGPSLPLSEDDLHLWLFPIPLADEALQRPIADLLDAGERAHVARFVFADDRLRRAHARGVLRLLLGRYLARDPQELRFQTNVHGKPVLCAADGLYFNLSHAQDRALIGLTRRAPVGVDLERIRALPERDALAAHCCSAAEQQWLADQPEDRRDCDFLRIWTVKEAVLKALGTGLTIQPESLSVRFPEADIAHPEVAGAGSPWTLFSSCSDAGYALAAGVQAAMEVQRIRCFHLPSGSAGRDGSDGNCTQHYQGE